MKIIILKMELQDSLKAVHGYAFATSTNAQMNEVVIVSADHGPEPVGV